ncbi:MAG: long-chain fatty acid--CoA ligase [Kineosporiaceae bacterium]
MQDRPLVLPHFFHRAEQMFGHKRIITAEVGRERTTTVAEWADRVRRLATVLDGFGLSADARVGTFCWNTGRHLELYFAAPCTGRVLHTLNIRLFPEQLVYVINHAEDEIVFVDRSLLPVFLPLADKLDTVKHIVVIDDGAPTPIPDDSRMLDYEELLASAQPFTGSFSIADENTAAAMCYTSGTTGDPKGVVYSHRSTVLHSLALLMADGVALSERDVVMPVVPMFHANAWGMPYGCLLAGSDLVFPGPNMTPQALVELLERHRVTLTSGVPTIWQGLLPLVRDHDLSALRAITCGGSSVPRRLSEGFRAAIGLPITQGWGMTETSPVGSLSVLHTQHDALSEDQRADVRARQGQALPLVELRIADPESGELLPWDDEATGELQAAGPWIAKAYYHRENDASFTEDGWLRTGDVAAMDRYGYFRLVDRTKDLIKSGGEWIVSLELENAILQNPKVLEAAVIGIPHEKWGERPLACVVVQPGETLTAEEVLAPLSERVAKWWVPDAVEFIDEVPKTSVGKPWKLALRQRFHDYTWPTMAGSGV